MVGVSCCLAGVNCTTKGENNQIDLIKQMVEAGRAIMVCPEVLGGLSIPREPCEIKDRKVISASGVDQTEKFYAGADKALKILQDANVKVALLKAKSPSCGKGKIYDGTFQNQLTTGDGIAVKVLEANGIRVYNEDSLAEFLKEID